MIIDEDQRHYYQLDIKKRPFWDVNQALNLITAFENEGIIEDYMVEPLQGATVRYFATGLLPRQIYQSELSVLAA